MRQRVARQFVGLYPRAWRERYATEFLALVEDRRDLRWRDVADIGVGAVREWLRLTMIGRALGVAVEMWTMAVVWSLIVASVGSLIVGGVRLLFGFESTLTLPFLSLDFARSLFVETPLAVGLAAFLAAPWLVFCRSTGLAQRVPVLARVVLLVPSIAVSVWFVMSAEQLTGVVAAGRVLSGHLFSRVSTRATAP